MWAARHRAIVALLWLHVPALAAVGLSGGLAPVHVAAETSVLAVAALVAGYAGLSRSARMASASIGLAFPTHGTSTEALMLAADAALYSAKAQGRDRTLVHAP